MSDVGFDSWHAEDPLTPDSPATVVPDEASENYNEMFIKYEQQSILLCVHC